MIRYIADVLVGAVALTIALPALAAEAPNWALAPEPDGHSLGFFFEDTSNAENLGALLTCAHDEGESFVGNSLLIVSDDSNAATAKALADFDPFGDAPAAQFAFGKTTVPAPVSGFQLQADELNGAWDLTIDFRDGDAELIHQLAAAAKSDTIKITVVGHTFDLTPQAADFTAFKKFAAKC